MEGSELRVRFRAQGLPYMEASFCLPFMEGSELSVFLICMEGSELSNFLMWKVQSSVTAISGRSRAQCLHIRKLLSSDV